MSNATLKARVLATAAAFVASGTLVLGTAGQDLIQSSEGVVYRSYRDPIGIITACYGHVSPHLRMGMTFTKQECDILFHSDVIKHQVVIKPGDPKNCIANAPLNNNQSDAVTSFVFNLGTGGFCRTTMARKLAARDYEGAAKEFPKFKYAGGRVLPGLVTRRANEQALFKSKNTWVSFDLSEIVVMGSSTASDRR